MAPLRPLLLLVPLAIARAGAQASASAGARQLYISSFTAEQQSTGAGGAPQAPFAQTGTQLTAESTEIVRGLVEGFLHRQDLKSGELECLSKGAGGVTGDMVQTVSNVLLIFEQATGGHKKHRVQSGGSTGASPPIRDGAGDIEAKIDAMTASAGAGQGRVDGPGSVDDEGFPAESEEVQRNKKKESDSLDLFYGTSGNVGRRRLHSTFNPKLMAMAPSLIMQTGLSLKQVTELAHSMAKDCLHHDALEALDQAALHMQNIEYVSGRLMSNGQDVLQELAGAAQKFKAHKYREFGDGFGAALRKVFLSDRGDSKLPEGLPGEDVVANVTRGLLRGVFGRGSELDLRLPGDVERAPQRMRVDLHECVSDNLNFFQSMWAEVMFFSARHAAGATSADDKVQWSTAVAMTMMNVPDALKKCNLGADEQEVLRDAAAAFADGGGGIGYDFKAPKGSKVSTDMLENHMAITVKDWASMKWSDFGEDMGHLLSEMAVTATNQKYAATGGGALRGQLSLQGDERSSWRSLPGLIAQVGVLGATASMLVGTVARAARTVMPAAAAPAATTGVYTSV